MAQTSLILLFVKSEGISFAFVNVLFLNYMYTCAIMW